MEEDGIRDKVFQSLPHLPLACEQEHSAPKKGHFARKSRKASWFALLFVSLGKLLCGESCMDHKEGFQVEIAVESKKSLRSSKESFFSLGSGKSVFLIRKGFEHYHWHGTGVQGPLPGKIVRIAEGTGWSETKGGFLAVGCPAKVLSLNCHALVCLPNFGEG